jgi:uncharacterized protein YjbI with pentapeptide repeats
MDTGLSNKLKENSVKNVDLKNFDFIKNKINFSGKRLENVDFSGNKTLKDVKFIKSILINCDFSNSAIEACDFRYAEIVDSTLEGAYFKFADFYRTAFKGITVFKDTKIEASSLNYISFETFCITRDNLVKTKPGSIFLIQENKDNFERFLTMWEREDSLGNKMPSAEKLLPSRYGEAERIYRQLSALWEAKGHNKDAGWAYAQGKKMERKKLLHENKNNKFINIIKAFFNLLAYSLLGYGVSLRKVLIAYVLFILIFGVIYKLKLPDGIGASMMRSLTYAATLGSSSSQALELIQIIQMTIGVLLTGFIGFVLANKIRKS